MNIFQMSDHLMRNIQIAKTKLTCKPPHQI